MEEALSIGGRGRAIDGVTAATATAPGKGQLPRGPVVKLCGLTRPEDVRAACSLGVWALGFVFAASPRRLSPAAARALAEEARRVSAGGGSSSTPFGPVLVGVFVDACAAEIGRVVKEVGLDAVQLHGLQTPAAAEVRSALGDLGSRVMLIRAIPVEPHATDAATGPEALGRAISRAREGTDLVLLDTQAAGRFGGSGRVFPWEIARRAAREAGQGKRLPFLVAGGIGPDNARAALVESGAWGVDVSSGVESAPGVKDHGLMRRLVAEVEEGRAP